MSQSYFLAELHDQYYCYNIKTNENVIGRVVLESESIDSSVVYGALYINSCEDKLNLSKKLMNDTFVVADLLKSISKSVGSLSKEFSDIAQFASFGADKYSVIDTFSRSGDADFYFHSGRSVLNAVRSLKHSSIECIRNGGIVKRIIVGGLT